MSDFSLYAKNKGSLHLQRFSRFLLDHHLRDFVKQQLILSREVEVPLLKYLKHFTEEQLIEISMVSLTEYLQYLSEDKGEELMEISLKKWEADELGLIGKFELLAEDISLINYVRSRTFRKFIPLFTNEATIALELIDELESFFVTSTITATNTYIRILKDQIAKNEKKLLEAQEIAHLGNFEWDLATNKSKNSPQIYSIFEVEEGITADSFMAYIHPEDKERVEDNLQKALVSGGYEHEYRFTKDGKTKYIFSTGKVLYNNEKPYKVIGTIQDVTGLKQIENRLLEKTIALEKSNESLEQFAHVASHDLKEPLRKISVLTDVIIKRENSLSESSRITLKKIHSASVQMQQMIFDIMDYSTVAQWQEKKLISLDELIREAIEFLEQAIEEKKATIQFGELPQVKVIASQFRQLFQNLISNAIKFSKPDTNPVVCFSYGWLTRKEVQHENLGEASKYLKLVVQDNGIGFKQEYSKQIFSLFNRLHAKTTYDGSGLGLAIAKRIIEHHGGVINATSKEGEGATFIIIIPQ